MSVVKRFIIDLQDLATTEERYEEMHDIIGTDAVELRVHDYHYDANELMNYKRIGNRTECEWIGEAPLPDWFKLALREVVHEMEESGEYEEEYDEPEYIKE